MVNALVYYRSMSRGARRKSGMCKDSFFDVKTVQVPLSHFTGSEVEYFDRKGRQVHIAYQFNVCLDMFVPYIAYMDDEPFVVPEYSELFPAQPMYDKSAVSFLDDFRQGGPVHRNQRYRAFMKVLPRVVAHQYWMAEELCVYGIKEFKLIETGVVLEGLIQKLLWEVFIPRYAEDGGFWGAASVCEGSYTDKARYLGG